MKLDLQSIEEMQTYDESTEMVYLAVPYTPVLFGFTLKGKFSKWLGKLVIWYRFNQVNKVAAALMKKGFIVFSPISHSHVIPYDNLDCKAWLKQDFWFVRRADLLYVLDLAGWRNSYGVNTEIEWARKLSIPVYLIDITGKTVDKLF